MDFTRLKQLVVPQGNIKQIAIAGRTVWRSPTSSANYGVEITTSNDTPITDFTLGNSNSKTFEATFNVPPQQQSSAITWSATGLPSGLSINSSTGVVSGTPTSGGDKTVTVTATQGDYSDTKTYTFTVYGLIITTSKLPYAYRYKNSGSYSTTLEVTQNVPSSAGKLTWSASGLPSGFSINSSTGVISGTPNTIANANYSVAITATRSPYIATRTLNLWAGPPNVAPTLSASSYDIGLYTTQCRDSSYVGDLMQFTNNNKTEFYITGNNLDYVSFLSNKERSYTDTFCLYGSGTATTPKVDVILTIASNTQIKVQVRLVTRSTAGASTLAKRGATVRNYQIAIFKSDGSSYYSDSFKSFALNISMIA